MNRAAAGLGARVGGRVTDIAPSVPELRIMDAEPGAGCGAAGAVGFWMQRWGHIRATEGNDGIVLDDRHRASFRRRGCDAGDIQTRLAQAGLDARIALAPMA